MQPSQRLPYNEIYTTCCPTWRTANKNSQRPEEMCPVGRQPRLPLSPPAQDHPLMHSMQVSTKALPQGYDTKTIFCLKAFSHVSCPSWHKPLFINVYSPDSEVPLGQFRIHKQTYLVFLHIRNIIIANLKIAYKRQFKTYHSCTARWFSSTTSSYDLKREKWVWKRGSVSDSNSIAQLREHDKGVITYPTNLNGRTWTWQTPKIKLVQFYQTHKNAN